MLVTLFHFWLFLYFHVVFVASLFNSDHAMADPMRYVISIESYDSHFRTDSSLTYHPGVIESGMKSFYGLSAICLGKIEWVTRTSPMSR